MPSIIDKNLLPEFDTIKDDDEKILWTDKPKFIPYAITSLGLGFGVFIFVGFYFAMAKNINNEGGTAGNLLIWFIVLPIVFFFSVF